MLPVQPGVPRARTDCRERAAAVFLRRAAAGAGSRQRRPCEHLRNWIPLALMLLAYKEMGWLAPARTTIGWSISWIVWDRMLLRRVAAAGRD